jgi:hypothetical protein
MRSSISTAEEDDCVRNWKFEGVLERLEFERDEWGSRRQHGRVR